MPKGRPGGNPDLVKYRFSTDKEESCVAKLTIRIPPSHYLRLKEVSNWQDKVRDAIACLLESEQTQLTADSLPATQDLGATEPTEATRNARQVPASRNGDVPLENETGDTTAKGKRKGSPRTRTKT